MKYVSLVLWKEGLIYWQKVSTQVSLRSPRWLTLAETFLLVKGPFYIRIC